MEISGVYDLTSGQNQFIDCDCSILEDNSCSARILCNAGYTKPQNIIKYITENSKLDEDGLFLAVILYNGALYIFSDSSTSQWVLYYTLAKNKFFYSTSLKKLLTLSGIRREFDLTAAKGFLKNGIVLGNHTLVNNVYKLNVCETIIVKKSKITSKQTKYTKPKKHTKQELISALRDSILKFAKGKKNIFMPLSGGFDSNMVLNTLKDSYTIDAFTVGGESGKNEIPIVEKNIKSYKNVTHHTCLADSSLFSKLPEIIWRLDGYVYERGIFLQYMLADLVSKNGGKHLICGECSDEHQCLLYRQEYKHYLHNKVSPVQTLDWMLQPYSWGNFVVLKKSALMLNSFGILGCYPFATKKFTDVAAGLGKKNLDKKLLYISLLENELPKELYDGLFHAGGSTSIETIISEVDKTNITQAVANSELIKKIYASQDCYKSFWSDFAELYLSEKGKNTPSVFKGYLKYVTKKILSTLNLYNHTFEPYDDSLENNIKAYYLLLFGELFLSGKYDENFGKETIGFEISI